MRPMTPMTQTTPQRSLLWRYFQALCRIVTTLWFDLKVYGIEHVPKTGPALLLANHQSYLDPVLVAVRLNRPVAYMAKSQLFENPMFSWFIRSLHAFPVRQGEGDIGAIRETVRQLEAGNLLNMYPEGSRTETGAIGPMLAGVALIIRKANVPVVPVAIIGSFESWPRRNKLFRPGTIRVAYGPVLDLSGLKGKQILERIDEAIRSLYEQLRGK